MNNNNNNKKQKKNKKKKKKKNIKTIPLYSVLSQSHLNQIQTIHSYTAKFIKRFLGSDFNEIATFYKFLVVLTTNLILVPMFGVCSGATDKSRYDIV